MDHDTKHYPQHVAVIMDGNGRWARQRGLPRTDGHREGIQSVDTIISASVELGIRTLFLYAFSTENWKRPQVEIAVLMKYLSDYLDKEYERLQEQNIRFTVIGRIDDFDAPLAKKIRHTIEATKNNTGLRLVLALSYGGRAEIIDAVRGIARAVQTGTVSPEQIDEKLFTRYLYVPDLPDPDLLIRTSGELRISNFLLWQISYTELYITDVLWPDFRRDEFIGALDAYRHRQRRYGQ